MQDKQNIAIFSRIAAHFYDVLKKKKHTTHCMDNANMVDESKREKLICFKLWPFVAKVCLFDYCYWLHMTFVVEESSNQEE